nr:putative ribonuclease H-like domain-containing protein [Tanacetum cinerariifolium]
MGSLVCCFNPCSGPKLSDMRNENSGFYCQSIPERRCCNEIHHGMKVAYSDSDYGGASQDRKSTTGGSQFLGRRLISWQCKKQTIVATSTTEAEYVAAASCCGQVLWIQNQLLDYG